MAICYLNNAASSWPKAPGVGAAVREMIDNPYVSRGRGVGIDALSSDRILFEARESVASLFNIKDSSRIIFTMNCTHALNIAIKGILESGDEVIHTSMDHNSVLRPLTKLRNELNIGIKTVQASRTGFIDPEAIMREVTSKTKMIILVHASNVTGSLTRLSEIGKRCRDRNIVFLADAAQTAGIFPIDVEKDNIDLLACPGHKGLLGPSGTGLLYIRNGIELKTFMEGGTGIRSDSTEQPGLLPERHESGTMNISGIAGLHRSVGFILEKGIENLRRHEMHLREKVIEKLSGLKGVILYGPQTCKDSVGVVSFNIKDRDPAVVSQALADNYGIIVRSGLHCAPLAHKSLATFPEGTVRIGLGPFTTEKELDILHEALIETIG